ncbi:MAG: hypothetical protein MUF83_15420, partial [Acidimicrobiales bacterium]|nr:hypothetical protein [Acidimicrobiales bacterium]
SGLLTPPPASATTGTMQYGANNNAGSSYTNLSSSNTTDTLDVFNSAATPVDAYARQPAGLYAQSNQVGVDGRGDRWGVHGTGDLAGVWAEGNIAATGVALRAEGGRAQLLLVPLGTAGPPSSGSHLRGELLVDVAGTMWLCVSGGTPGTWRELAGIPTTGAFHAITPVRVYDSRCPAPQPGTLSGGAWRIISVAHGRNLDTGVVTASNVVPSGAQAVTYNLTIVSQTGTGWLSVNPGSAATYGSSSVNWWAPGQILANGLVVKLDTNRQVKVFAGGGSTHFLIDVTGYYL